MKLRRSMLFLPANNPALIRDVHIYKPDSVMFDLEDAIALKEKDAARILIHNMLKVLKEIYIELGIETVVRINGLATKFWEQDVEAVVSAGVDMVRLPMTEEAEDVFMLVNKIEEVEKKCGRELGSTKVMVAIETALGVMNSFEIAKTSRKTDRLIAMALSGEDFVTSMKTSRSTSGDELFVARGMVAMAARSCGLEVLDTVYADVNNDEGFLKEANLIKTMGFGGKSLVHPRQVELIHEVFAPTEKEITHAKKVVVATREALAKNLGVFTVDGRMVDGPIIDRAKRVLQLAVAAKLISEEEAK
ncbi:citrate lyase subunit beta [Candidatus Epulonipiscium fishelsonii]|uniref:Citrate lyase subunit beta n=1 Tax=Candidatus Epulonipiscium fishelsonii TaxID=77094 RepID=A0ACC8XA18_9FIRM|nr:citrate lyase subunit beta [Epulopiscium sp. SCG-B11WGA-EpuloA1]ONI43777.1 citrate lyase subunit beta [Epulopiscium sp. SCG-B05WGA-EpuloA1]